MNLEDNGILRREELLEMSISLCGGIAEYLLKQGVGLSVYANARDCISGQKLQLENLADGVSLEGLYKALARLDINSEMEKFGTAFEEKLGDAGRSLYTIFISPDIHEDYQQVLLDYQKECGKEAAFVWICPVKKQGEQEILQELAGNVIFIQEQQNI